MTRENLIERIKKLLSLASSNPSASEAAAAALKAQKLIADNDVSKDELYERVEENISEVCSNEFKGNLWALRLAKAIADNFRCQLFRRSVRECTGLHHMVVFVGYETDAQAAALTFNKLFEMGNRLADAEARIARSKYGTARGVRVSFLIGRGDGGYVGGIRKELERQSHELMLVRSQEVNDYFERATEGLEYVRASRRHPYREGYDSKGYEAGRDALRSTRMGGRLALED